jgi:hypothetical protein
MRPEDLLAWSEELGAPFDTADVYRAGGSNRDLVRMVDAKAWHRLGRGSFVSTALWAIANERARHRMAVAARLRGKDARWAAARRSAAVFHDLPLLGRVPTVHETALESLSWAACHTLGLEMPEPQVQVFLGSRLIARVDGLWRTRNTIGQADGLYKYNDRLGVIKDKKQDEELEDLGFEVARWGWDEAYRPEGVLDDRLRRAFERGSRQQLDPRVRLVATTLEQSLKWTGLIAS